MLTKEIEKFIEEHEKEAIELLKELARIPAPSGLEERRAEFCLEWLKKQGAEGVYIDEALNVVYPIDVADEGRVDVFMAHLDVVFPDEDELPLKDCDGRIYCPGVGDDTACVVCLMMAAEYIAAQKKEGKWRKRNDRGLLLVCNSCEEGLGNLKGVKEICRAFEDRISTFCTFDSKLDKIVDRAVGSKRFRIQVRTEGGHSFGDFGKANAIEKMAEIITELYQVKVPCGGKSTYNVGTISGGTGVNVIAQNAEMLYEFRSDSHENLQIMEAYFENIIRKKQEEGLDVSYEVIGLRPCGKDVDALRQEALTVRAERAVENVIGKKPERNAGSTDCNIPLSLGIPSICVGCYYGHGSHTREEYIEKDSLIHGTKVAFEMILVHRF